MEQASQRLRDALVAAVRPYLATTLAERGWPGLPEAVLASTESWLAVTLDTLLTLPFRDQSRVPLEVFQEAMTGPTEALARAGVAVPRRDPAAAQALPGDVYDLAPASSAALGEEAWAAHLAWGAAKAGVVTRPACGLLSANLLDIDPIERAAAAAGFRLERLRVVTQVSDQAVVFVDLEQPLADAVIAAAAQRGIRAVAFGPHVDELAMTRARSLGAAEAVPRSRFFADPGAFLPKYL